MTPALIWLIGQTVAAVLNRVQQAGKYDSLTQAEAEAELQRIANALHTDLPSPDSLIHPPTG